MRIGHQPSAISHQSSAGHPDCGAHASASSHGATGAAFPFAAVAGMDLARRALLLVAVDTGLKGALIASGPGAAKSLLGRSFQSLLPDTAFLELPLGITEDRLLGSLDLEETLLTGRWRMLPGLLARVHGGVLYVDEINLLDRNLARHVALALSAGAFRLEREGLRQELPSDFALIGTYDPEEGAVSAPLMDAVGLHVMETGCFASEDRSEILHRVAAFDRDPAAFARQFASETALMKQRIAQARSRVPRVDATFAERRRLSAAAVRLGVEGNRADIFALRAARAHAALMGRTCLQEEDLQTAVQLVLLPRAGIPGQPRPAAAQSESGSRLPESAASHPPLSAARRSGQLPDALSEELVIQALDCGIEPDILRLPRRSDPDEAGRQAGRRGRESSERTQWDRGRCVRTVAARPRAAQIALGATLRAAAPFQTLRPRSAPQQPAIRVTSGDLRFKQFKQNRGILIIFAVDASGSMAVNRINQAKGALIRLLGKAYLNRDQVALIGFRGNRAEVLLAPTRSVELAKRAVDALPVGGGTPLAAGLEAALTLARQPRLAERQTLLVLLTDGRANVPRNGDSGLDPRQAVWHEIEQVCAGLQAERVVSVVIDTTHHVLSSGEASRVAELLGGRLVHLPAPDLDTVYKVVAGTAEAVRTWNSEQSGVGKGT